MSRRLKLVDPPRYEVPRARCIVGGCSTEPQPGMLICFICARALARKAEEAAAEATGGEDPESDA